MQEPYTLKNICRSVLTTALFNTGIALVLSITVFKQQVLENLIICSNLIGFSIFTCVRVSDYLLSRKKIVNPALGKTTGLFFGIVFGSLSSWFYLCVTWQMSPIYFLENVLFYLSVFGLFFGLPIIYYFSSQRELAASRQLLQDEKIRRLTIEKEAAMTSIRLFQAQIEPHFLFNTLSTILSLFETDVEKAKMMLMDLNVFLRGCLEFTRKEMVTLEKELEITTRYLNLFKIRMGERLTYSIHDHTGFPQMPFPPLIIQPLVENSIKYGLEPKVKGGSITISCRTISSVLEILIEDTGLGLEKDMVKAGVGLDNVSRRLDSIYGDAAAFSVESAGHGGTRVTIRIKQ